MSPNQFVDMLNGKNELRLKTSVEDEYTWYWDEKNPFCGEGGDYFSAYKIGEISIHRLDLQAYLSKRQAMTESATAEDQIKVTPELLEDEIPADKIRKKLGMSRIGFIDFLNDDRVNRLLTSDEEGFRNYRDSNGYRSSIVPYFTVDMIKDITIDCIDWENWKALQDSNQGAEVIDDNGLKSRIAELASQLAESLAERGRLSADMEAAKARIAELETASRDTKQDVSISALQAELNKLRGHISQHRALATVLGMLEKGDTKEKIARFLKDQGLSYAQVGVLLHDDPLCIGNDAITMCAKRLLGIAK